MRAGSSNLRTRMAGIWLGLSSVLTATGCQDGAMSSLSKAVYLDKCRGAWAGQMIGVCYGEPYQFRSNGRPVTGPMQAWTPDRIAGAARQDDVYVELTFLAALERYGPDVTSQQAGEAFAATPYPLWHANLYGRENIRKGIMPPQSGHPQYNRHADDIDFQIEADLFGIIAPGMPRESNRLCDIFGHIMNFGDGVYGGMFVAGMYTAAYFESDDVMKVIQAGMACIPPASRYYQCIADTVRWCREHPDNWLAAWKKVEAKWNDDLDCIPGNPHNIDAKINGAYIVIGLMYGGGDLLKTVEICTRCGQDADSSTANAGGIIGAMKGYDSLGQDLIGGIGALAGQKFLGTDYEFEQLAPACLRVTEKLVQRTGGRVTDEALLIRRQSPAAPSVLEQWEDKAEMIKLPVTAHEIALWDKGWKVKVKDAPLDAGFYPREYGRTNVLMIFPIDPDHHVILQRRLSVPNVPKPTLHVEAASEDQHGSYLLTVYAGDRQIIQSVVDTKGEFIELTGELPANAGSSIEVRLEIRPIRYALHAAYLRQIDIR